MYLKISIFISAFGKLLKPSRLPDYTSSAPHSLRSIVCHALVDSDPPENSLSRQWGLKFLSFDIVKIKRQEDIDLLVFWFCWIFRLCAAIRIPILEGMIIPLRFSTKPKNSVFSKNWKISTIFPSKIYSFYWKISLIFKFPLEPKDNS